MRKLKNNKRLFSSLLAAVYLFVALFSQNFHHHGSGLFFKDFHFKKSVNTFSKSLYGAGFEDCLSCHIAANGNTLAPEESGFEFSNLIIFEEQSFFFTQEFLSFSKTFFHLRAPPKFI